MPTTMVKATLSLRDLIIIVLLFQFASSLSESAGGASTSTTGVSSTATVAVHASIEDGVRHNRTAHVGSSSRPLAKTTKSLIKGPNAPNVKIKHEKSSLSSSTRNMRSDSLRRIRSEWKNVVEAGMGYHWKRMLPIRQASPSHMWLGPLDERNLYVWHFTLVGLPGSPYGNGLYHGRIVLPSSYPLQPPRVQVWTPSGRFVPRVDICLSASHYHPETWSPTHWSIRTLVEALRLHMVTPPFEIGGMPNVSFQMRRAYAKQSLSWKVRIPLFSTASTQQQHSVISIDHEHMIQQGLFDGILENEETDAEECNSTEARERESEVGATCNVSSLDAAPSPPESNKVAHAEIGHIQADSVTIASAVSISENAARTNRKPRKKPKRKSTHEVIPGRGTATSAKSTRRVAAATSRSQRSVRVVEPLGVRIIVAALRLVPLLVCLLLWRLVTSWFLPS